VKPIDSPENWLICQVLRREADQLIAGHGTSTQGLDSK
jgi:hypothetical protein